MMCEDTIEVLRAELEELIRKGAKYEDICEASKKLDKYITKYYVDRKN